jgi:hypothetical protein
VIASIWDGFTTLYATLQVLGNGFVQIAAGLLLSALILAFVLNTKRVVSWRGGFVGALAKLFWFIAFCLDAYTSWIANSALVVPGTGTARETILLIGLTLLVTASPIILSAVWQLRSTTREELPRDTEASHA